MVKNRTKFLRVNLKSKAPKSVTSDSYELFPRLGTPKWEVYLARGESNRSRTPIRECLVGFEKAHAF
jgi:hypothetical protein